jgi:outer membrane protein assembly factor BamB
LVQTREELAGVGLEDGEVLWIQEVLAFRGMNILTPVVVEDDVFTSSYRNKSWLYRVTRAAEQFSVETVWSNNVQGYMSTPVVIDGHAYLHLQNRRFACINLETGERTWTSQPVGKYASLIAQDDRFLALDARGRLLLIKANPQEFELIDEVETSGTDTWAHLAVSGNEIFIRELGAIAGYRWRPSKTE